MRFLTFVRDGSARLGVLRDGERVLDVGEQAGRLNFKLPFDTSNMLKLIESGAAGLAAVRKLLQAEGADFALAA